MNTDNQPRFGFVNFAETWNGRMAMMGILIGLGTELITGQIILRQIGIGYYFTLPLLHLLQWYFHLDFYQIDC